MADSEEFRHKFLQQQPGLDARVTSALQANFRDAVTKGLLSAHTDAATGAHAASAISITDAGSYYSSGDVEGALDEVGNSINTLGSDLAAHEALSFGAGHALPTAATPMNGYGFTSLGDLDFSTTFNLKIAGTTRVSVNTSSQLLLNSKIAISFWDTWIRLNEGGGFTGGIYCASSVVRTDNQFQVGGSGAAFLANASGQVRINGGTNSARISIKGNATSAYNGAGIHIEETSYPRSWMAAVRSDGMFTISDETAASSRLKIDTNGRLKMLSTAAGNGFELGGDTGFSRASSGVFQLDTGDKFRDTSDPSHDDDLSRKAYVDDAVAALWASRCGVIEDFALPSASVPSGAVLCYGQAYTTDDMLRAALISAGYPYGGSGTSPLLPDLRGRGRAGLDNMGGSDAGRLSWANTLGTTGGTETHTLTTSEIPSHTHPFTQKLGGSISTVANVAGAYVIGNANTENRTTDATGGGGSHNNMQPTMLLNAIIWTGEVP